MQYRNIIRRCSCTGIFALIIVDLIRGIILVTVTVVIASAGIISTIVTAVTVVISIVTVTTVVGISIIRVFAVISVSGVVSLIRGICIIIIVIIITVIEMLVTVSVGMVPMSKYSVITGQPALGRSPVSSQTLNFSTLAGFSNSLEGSPSWIRVITFFHKALWKLRA